MVSIISNKIPIPHVLHNYNIFVTDLKLQPQCDTEICIFEIHSQHTSPPYGTPHFPIFHTIHIYNLTNYFISLERKSSSQGRMSQVNRKNYSIPPLLSVDLLANFSYLLKVKYSMMLQKKKCVQRNYQFITITISLHHGIRIGLVYFLTPTSFQEKEQFYEVINSMQLVEEFEDKWHLTIPSQRAFGSSLQNNSKKLDHSFHYSLLKRDKYHTLIVLFQWHIFHIRLCISGSFA